MRFGRQKKKIISLVLVFGCIYAVNACAHPLVGSFTFHISNQAPKSDFGDITISSDSEPTKPCKNSSGDLFSIDIPSLGAGSTDFTKIGIQYGSTNDFCYADIQYGGKYTTKVKITWVAATDGGNGAVFHSITTKNGDPLGSDQAFTNWRDEINQQTIGYLIKVAGSTDSTTKIYTLTYSRYTDKALPIKLSNNSNNDKLSINFEIPSDAPKLDCIDPTSGTTSGEVNLNTSKSVYFSLQGSLINKQHSNFHCLADLVINDNKTKKITIPINVVYHDESKTLTVEIATLVSPSTTNQPVLAFNKWNDTFAVNKGTMMKLDLSTAGQVNFKNTPLPFPLLAQNPDGRVITNSLDYMANKLLTNDTIFADYKSNISKTSRDIAQHMLIAAGMMKLHSQIPDDPKHEDYSFSAWNDKFHTLYADLKGLRWPTTTTADLEKWSCPENGDAANDPCDIPLEYPNTTKYGKTLAPDDTIAQTYFAAAFLMASKALKDKALKDKGVTQGDATVYKNISQKIQDAIYTNNTTTELGKTLLKGTQVLTLNNDSITPQATYSATILPLIYLFGTTDADPGPKNKWFILIKKTVDRESNFLSLISPDKPGQNIPKLLEAGIKESDDLNRGDLSYGYTDPGPFPTNGLTFGMDRDNWSDDSYYVPMSLGAYFLVNPLCDNACMNQFGPFFQILQAETKSIDNIILSDQHIKDPNEGYAVICGPTLSLTSLSCTATGEKLHSHEMSSTLLAQLGISVYNGRRIGGWPQNTNVKRLTTFLQEEINDYQKGRTSDISSIILTGLYIDGAITTTHPLLEIHLSDYEFSQADGQIYYYFNLEPNYSGQYISPTLGAQVRSGAQTFYRGE